MFLLKIKDWSIKPEKITGINPIPMASSRTTNEENKK